MKRAVVAAACGLALGACTPDFVTNDQSEVLLVITNISGESQGGNSGDNALNSDVSPVFDDQASIEVQSLPKNATSSVTGGRFQDVTIERYEVRYIRSDGRGTEGVDVPYHITGNISQTVPYRGTATVVIDVVRHQAKFEPPLRNLAGNTVNLDPTGVPIFGGGAIIITCFAEITLHGRTPTGAAVVTSGRMQINFADFAD